MGERSAWRDLREVRVLVAVLFIVLGLWGFIELADEVTEGEADRFDNRVLHALQRPEATGVPRGPRWLLNAARDVTGLGSITVLGLITLAVMGYLWLTHTYRAMWLMLIATSSGLALSTALKFLFHRPRPGGAALDMVLTPSFPSGHSLLSAVVYLTLGAMLARVSPHRVTKIYFLGIALLLTFLVGVSRVYLGVHYPTDVLAGWTLGLVWALLWWLLARYLQARGAVERDTLPPS